LDSTHHFKELQNLQKEGKLILAGRTLNIEPSGFGIVILEMNSEEEAIMLMENDPAVKKHYDSNIIPISSCFKKLIPNFFYLHTT
jgi:uncharacterized protein YciI